MTAPASQAELPKLAHAGAGRAAGGNPNTATDYRLSRDLTTRGQPALQAALRHRRKGPALIGTILDAVFHTIGVGFDEGQDALVSLLAEPALTLPQLRDLIWGAGVQLGWDTVAAACGHALAGEELIVTALWNAPEHVAAAVGRSSGSLLPGATKWVSRQPASNGQLRGVGTECRDRIAATVQRWEHRCAGVPQLRAFVAAASFGFTDEDSMFAAGAAIIAAPTGPVAPDTHTYQCGNRRVLPGYSDGALHYLTRAAVCAA